jgi:hypothetical protein
MRTVWWNSRSTMAIAAKSSLNMSLDALNGVNE